MNVHLFLKFPVGMKVIPFTVVLVWGADGMMAKNGEKNYLKKLDNECNYNSGNVFGHNTMTK